jgi:hypothetical protein
MAVKAFQSFISSQNFSISFSNSVFFSYITSVIMAECNTVLTTAIAAGHTNNFYFCKVVEDILPPQNVKH